MWSRDKYEQTVRKVLPVIGYVAVLTGLYFLEHHSFLLFHTVVELFSVCVAGAIFMIVWNSRHFIQNNYMLFLGTAYLFIGGFDFLHTITYEGMGVFKNDGPNLPTQLWIMTRYMESLSMLLAPLFLRRRLNASITLAVYAVISAVLLVSVFLWPVFPVCFRPGATPGTGVLTPFKDISEFIIVGILFLALIALLLRRSWFDSKVLRWLMWSIVLTMASELTFTMYTDPHSRIVVIGHLLKLVSFFLMYKALIETGMRQPHTLLYRRLKEHESALQRAHDELEIRVQQRTAELSQTVETLKDEVRERMRAEEAYRESESKFRTLVEQTPAITYTVALDDPDTVFYVSPQMETITGFSVDDCLNHPGIWPRQLHPDDRQRVLEQLATAKSQDLPFSCEYRFLTRDGDVIWLHDEARVVKDEYGHPRYTQGVAYDVTKEKRMAQELAQQSRTLEAFFKHAITPLVILDRHFNFVRVNEAYAQACQREISDFIGHNHFEIYPGDEVHAIFEQTVATKTPYEATARPFSFPDHPEWGVTYWDWTLVPLLDDAGEVEFLVFSLRDVTRRRQAELAVIEKEAHLRTVVSSAPVIFFATDENGTITVAEGKGLASLGQKPEDWVGSNIFDRYRDRPEIVENMRRALAGKEAAAEVEMVPVKIFDWRFAPVKDEKQHISGVMGVAVDITEEKLAQQEILAHQEQLRDLTTQLLSVEDQERRRIATALHDSIGQILAFLKIELGTLQRLELPEKAAVAIAHAREQVEEAVRQTRNLTFEISPPELYTLGLESALEELAQRFSQERQIECQVRSDGDIEPMGNQLKTLLYRAVRELLTNAAKHANAQTVEIELGPINGNIRIAVKDDGSGLDLRRLDADMADSDKGFGLLSIRERLTYLGGTMDIRSAAGKGTEVILTVPSESTRTFDRSTP